MNDQSDISKQSCTFLEKKSLENFCPACDSLVSANITGCWGTLNCGALQPVKFRSDSLSSTLSGLTTPMQVMSKFSVFY